MPLYDAKCNLYVQLYVLHSLLMVCYGNQNSTVQCTATYNARASTVHTLSLLQHYYSVLKAKHTVLFNGASHTASHLSFVHHHLKVSLNDSI
jgi:hypothetical protein